MEQYYQKAFPAAAPFAAPCFLSTIETTVQPLENGRYFVVTGDIPAMWLRDSSVQVINYIPYATHDASVQTILRGVIAKQADDICIDAYANAFNACANGKGFQDVTHCNPSVWERKYEVDSLLRASLFGASVLERDRRRCHFFLPFSANVVPHRRSVSL